MIRYNDLVRVINEDSKMYRSIGRVKSRIGEWYVVQLIGDSGDPIAFMEEELERMKKQ